MSKMSKMTISCDKCDFITKEYAHNDVYHYSGYINGKYSKHIHLCEDCVRESGINIRTDFGHSFDRVRNA